MSDATKIIGARIRRYRKSAELSREDLAEAAGLHPTYLGQLERGEKNVTIDTLVKVSDALDVSLSMLFEDFQKPSDHITVAARSYNLIHRQSDKKQKLLYSIINEIINYEDNDAEPTLQAPEPDPGQL